MALTSYGQRRRTARRRLILLGAALMAAVIGAAVVLMVTNGSDSRKTAQPSSGNPSSGPSTDPTAPPTGGTTDVTVLPKPGGVSGGVPVGYPHTTEGAISAAAHFTDVLDLFSPAAAGQQARVIAEPGFLDTISLYTTSAARTARVNAGLPRDGTADLGTYSMRQSRAYRLASTRADRVTVWLLVDDTVSVRGVVKASAQVSGAVMVWTGADWRMGLDTLNNLPAPAPALATPGTAQAVQEGWRPLAYEK